MVSGMKAEKSRISLGRLGESAASDYLVKNGYNIIKTNFRVGKLGEVDIIASQGDCLCFIEVKTRQGTAFGLPCEAVNYKKQNTIRKIAAIYINNLKRETQVRFDIVEIIGTLKGNELEIKSINLLQNAF